MRTVPRSLAIVSLLAISPAVTAGPPAVSTQARETLARAAVSPDPAVAAPAIARLRGLGPDGLEAFVAVHRAALDASLTDVPDGHDAAAGPLHRAIDAIGAQRDNFASRLYWYTDLDAALARARATHRPVLSLHMLGRLDEAMSCANSRLFRSAVYANESVSAALRESFVLHWHTVRPVPRVTIDFGDGRTLERTITGNSCHIVLDTEGRPIDAIPGLYGPRAFLGAVEQASSLFGLIGAFDGPARAGLAGVDAAKTRFLAAHHRTRVREIRAAWSSALAQAGAPLPGVPRIPDGLTEWHDRDGGAPAALVAAPIAVTKAGLELPLLNAMEVTGRRVLAEATDDATWARIASARAWAGTIDARGAAVMRRHGSRSARARADLERSLALDTVRNEFLLHHEVHVWFGDGLVGDDVAALSDRVYAELFLTPGTDPWLGLHDPDRYTALDGAGVCAPATIR